MSSGNKVFGKRIKELRERKKLTQEKLAASFENLEKLANALDVTMADLFNFGHLKTKEELIKEINTELSTSSEKDVQRIHKLIFGYLK